MPPPGAGPSLMRTVGGPVGQGGQPDQMESGPGDDVAVLMAAIDAAPPDVLLQLKQAIDAKLASSSSQQDGLGGQG